ncbi:esterase-like activity of phytase family protein [Halocynthiibacter sp.]|uniref:esterase-like activity of phytase family protein n=1 Tax=Halocynthiibacter sp. TaxID=1979210 RepID=UPI003C574CD7
MCWRFRSTLILALLSPAAMVGDQLPPAQAVFLDNYTVGNHIPGFGGLSGLEISENGNSFFALSDRSILFEGQFARQNEHITDVMVRAPIPLLQEGGTAFHGKSGDSEGLALTNDGRIVISFEGIPRLSALPHPRLPSAGLNRFERPDDFQKMPENAALEALAVDSAGTFYTLPEDTRDGSDFPVWRFRDNIWDQPFLIPRVGDYLPVGADFSSDGDLYLLERRLALTGFASRIRRFRISGNMISDGEIILETAPGQHDNLEGIALWRDDQGHIRITMVSDNNYFILQRTEFVEYMIP